jgi:hypothetical protein
VRTGRMLSRAHTQSNKLGIAANMAVAKAFPDRGGGGYLRALHTELVKVVDLGPAISAPAPGAYCWPAWIRDACSSQSNVLSVRQLRGD